VLSRAAPEFVVRLFEQEVPEIYDNTVVIKACAREAGERTKIAVFSRDRDVDSVGACVGMKGMRVQSIIRELRGEKIDIIEYSEDPVVFATHALSPAKISRVAIVDASGKHMEVIVDDTQLSLAIGKKGQNVRLAAKLLGWKIDIKSEEEKRQEVESQMAALVVPGAPVSVLLDHGLAERTVEKLIEAGIGTVEKLGGMTPEELEQIQGIGPEMVQEIQAAVNSYYSQFEQALETPAVEETGESTADESTTDESTADESSSAELKPAETGLEPAGAGVEPAEPTVEEPPEDEQPPLIEPPEEDQGEVETETAQEAAAPSEEQQDKGSERAEFDNIKDSD
jgi:N utilization substance protein A